MDFDERRSRGSLARMTKSTLARMEAVSEWMCWPGKEMELDIAGCVERMKVEDLVGVE